MATFDRDGKAFYDGHIPSINRRRSDLKPGDIIHLSQLKLPKGVEIVALHLGADHDTTVVTANAVKEESEEAPAADAAEAAPAAAPAKDKK